MPVREALQRLTGERALTMISGALGRHSAARRRPPAGPHRRADRAEGTAAEWAAARIGARHLTSLRASSRQCAKPPPPAIPGPMSRLITISISPTMPPPVPRPSSASSRSLAPGQPLFPPAARLGNYIDANVQHRLALQALKRRDARSCRRHIRQDIQAATGFCFGCSGRKPARKSGSGRSGGIIVWPRKNRIISRDASGRSGSEKLPSRLPPDQACPPPSMTQYSAFTSPFWSRAIIR